MCKQSLLHGLFSVVRAEVLRLLFTDGTSELYGRELARRSFLAPHMVQDELAKLDAAGLIVSRSNGTSGSSARMPNTRFIELCGG